MLKDLKEKRKKRKKRKKPITPQRHFPDTWITLVISVSTFPTGHKAVRSQKGCTVLRHPIIRGDLKTQSSLHWRYSKRKLRKYWRCVFPYVLRQCLFSSPSNASKGKGLFSFSLACHFKCILLEQTKGAIFFFFLLGKKQRSSFLLQPQSPPQLLQNTSVLPGSPALAQTFRAIRWCGKHLNSKLTPAWNREEPEGPPDPPPAAFVPHSLTHLKVILALKFPKLCLWLCWCTV